MPTISSSARSFTNPAGPRAAMGSETMTSGVKLARSCRAAARPAARSAAGALACPARRPEPSKHTPMRSIPSNRGSPFLEYLLAHDFSPRRTLIIVPGLPGGVTVPALAAGYCEPLKQGGKLCAFGGGQGCQETALLFVQDPHGRDLGAAAGVGRVD